MLTVSELWLLIVSEDKINYIPIIVMYIFYGYMVHTYINQWDTFYFLEFFFLLIYRLGEKNVID